MIDAPNFADSHAASFTEDYSVAEAVSDRQKPPVSFEEFLAQASDDDAYKYEWVNGQIIKTERTMNPEQLYILYNLQEKFYTTETHRARLGNLESEFGARMPGGNLRRPDIGYLTKEQVYAAKTSKAPLLPSFAVEIISGSEKSEETEGKLNEYLDAGIQVVWQIFPNLKKVRVHHADGSSKNCSHPDAICSAAPALPDFEMTVGEVFWQPET